MTSRRIFLKNGGLALVSLGFAPAFLALTGTTIWWLRTRSTRNRTAPRSPASSIVSKPSAALTP